MKLDNLGGSWEHWTNMDKKRQALAEMTSLAQKFAESAEAEASEKPSLTREVVTQTHTDALLIGVNLIARKYGLSEPESRECLEEALVAATKAHYKEDEAPSLWVRFLMLLFRLVGFGQE